MAQGNYYSNLALALSTQDTSSVANSISTALEGSTKAINSAYEAGKDANDAFANILDTKDTALGRVLDYYSTKEAKSNIEANKQKQLDEATENNKMKEAEALAAYNAMEGEYINNITRGATGQSYDDMKSNLDKIITSASDGNVSYEQYMYYQNNPQLIRDAQRFKSMSNGANTMLDETGKILTSPIDLKVLDFLEKMEKDTNFSRLAGKMRDIESEKERINKGIVTEEEFHQIYKDSRENAYKVAGAYDEKSFRDTMNVMSRKDIITNWSNNFNANVTPVLWKEDTAKAIVKTEENAKASSVSADSILKNNPPPKVPDKTDDDYTPVNSYEDKALQELNHKENVLTEHINKPDVIKKQDAMSKDINSASKNIFNRIGEESSTGQLKVFDTSTMDTRGFVGATNDWVKSVVPESIRPYMGLITSGGEAFLLYKYLPNGEYVDKDGKKLEGDEKKAAQEIDKEAGVKETDTPKEAEEKKKKWYKSVKDKAADVSKKYGSNVLNYGKKSISGGKWLFGKVLPVTTEGLSLVDNISMGLNDIIGIGNISDSRLAPMGDSESFQYQKVFKGQEASQVFIDVGHNLANWKVNDPKTWLNNYSKDDIVAMIDYVKFKLKHLENADFTTIGQMFQLGGKDKQAFNQANMFLELLETGYQAKVLEENSPQYQLQQVKNDIKTIKETPPNLKAYTNVVDTKEQIANSEKSSGSGRNLTELKNKELEQSAIYKEANKKDLASNFSDGMTEVPELLTDDKVTFGIDNLSSLNDATRTSMHTKGYSSKKSVDKYEATNNWLFRGFTFDEVNGTQNMRNIQEISKDENVKAAMRSVDEVITSDNWGGMFQKLLTDSGKGELHKRFSKLVGAYRDSFEKYPLKVSVPLTPEDEKEFNTAYKQGLVKNNDLATKMAFKYTKWKIYESSADKNHLDMSDNDNLRRLNQSKVLEYFWGSKTPSQIKEQSRKDNQKATISQTSQYEKVVGIKDKNNNEDTSKKTPKGKTINYDGFVTIEKAKGGNKEGTRISLNGSPNQIKPKLEQALKDGNISQKEFDRLIKSLDKR